jgi:hypothetical protein
MPIHSNCGGKLCSNLAYLKCNRYSSNSWSTTNVLAFVRGRTNGKLGGVCWRALSTYLYYQHDPQKEENIHSTYIYLCYWPVSTFTSRIDVIAETNTGNKWNRRRICFLESVKGQRGATGHNQSKPGQVHPQHLGPGLAGRQPGERGWGVEKP